MRSLILTLLLIFPLSTVARSALRVQVHDFDLGESVHEEVLVFLSNGQVVKLKQMDAQLYDQLTHAKHSGQWLDISINAHREIVKAQAVNLPPSSSYQAKSFNTDTYVPSVIPSMLEAQKLFEDARKTQKEENQCFNRAHVWSYEWRVKNNLFTTKAWLFFTRKYIRRFNFEWWFHVAPVFHVMVNGKLEERVADIKYSKGPIPIQLWTNGFMRNDPVCPVVKHYSDYA